MTMMGQDKVSLQPPLSGATCNPGIRASFSKVASTAGAGFKRKQLAMAITLAAGTIAAPALLPVQSAEAAELACPTTGAGIGVIDTLSIVSGNDTLSAGSGITQCQVVFGPIPQGRAEGQLVINGSLSNSIELLTGGSEGPAGSINIYGTLINEDSGVIKNNINPARGQGEINVLAGGSLVNHGRLDNYGTLSNLGTLSNEGTLTNNGSLVNSGTIDAGGSLTNNTGGTLTNNGKLYFSGFKNYGTLINNGTLDDFRLDWTNNGIFRNNSYVYFGRLVNNDTMVNNDTLYGFYYSRLTNNGKFTNNGLLHLADYASAVTNKGTLVNNGTIRADWGLYNETGGTLINRGTLNTDYQTNDGTITNIGVIGLGFVYNRSVLNNEGKMDVDFVYGEGSLNQTGGSLHVTDSVSQSKINVAGGTLTGNGTLSSSSQALLIGDAAILAPGDSVGQMTVVGDLDLDGTLALEIGSPVSADRLTVTGLVDLSGFTDTLDLDLLGGYTPQLGDSWNVLFADTISGEFDKLLLPDLVAGLRWQTEYLLDEIGPTDVFRLSVSQVPLPAAAWLFGSALGLLGWAGRKRQRAPT